MKPQLTFLHVVGGAHIGYGRLGVYLAKTMREQGVTVFDAIADAPPATGQRPAEMLEEWGERTAGLSETVAWCAVPTHARGWWRGQNAVIFTMFETDTLPNAYRENLHEFSTVIVPSVQNLELFSEFHDNVKYVPLGVDPMRWHYRPRPEVGARFNFLIGGSGQRKGTDLAVKAFRAAFPEGSWGDGPVPYLVMKQPKPEDFYGARIERVTGRMSGEAEAALYGEAHCYLQPSRGEGFGLQPLQAITQGIPTILTDAHGHKAFSHLGMGIGSKPSPAGYFIYGPAGNWWEPDLDELIDTMRWVYMNYGEAKERAHRNSKVALDEFTWENCTNQFLDAIGRDRLGSYHGDCKEWYKPTSKLYRTVLNCYHVADVGGTIYVGEKGEEYWWPADVKRLLYEAGKLDPVCCESGDTGLLPQQVDALPGYRERVDYCPTCHQKFGSGTTRLAEILADPREIVLS